MHSMILSQRVYVARVVHVLLLAAMWSATAGHAAAQPTTPWWERAREGHAGHYWIKTDLPPNETRELAQHLNLMYDAMAARLGKLPQRQPERLNVLIFHSRDDYLHTLNARYGVDARFTGGIFFVVGDQSALAFWTEGLPRQRVLNVLQHEAFHQFAFSRFGSNLPIWVNEGLAEFFGEAVLVGRDLVIGQSKPRVIDAVKKAIDEGEHIPFNQIIGVTSDGWRQAMSQGRGQLQYNQAWSMVQFLIYGEGGRYQKAFEQYLWLLNDGIASEQAFMQAFQTNDINAFEQRWKQYAREARPSSFVTAMERAEFLAQGLLALAKREIVPQTLEELKQHLREIKFTYTITTHGMAVVLDSADDAMFEIPMDDLARQQPVFTLTPIDPRRLNRRQRVLEEDHPTPPTLATEHLRPRGISVQWSRDRDDNTLSYELVVR